MAKIVRVRVRVCTLNVALPDPLRGPVPPLRGGKGAGKPKADRANTKRKRNVTLPDPLRGPV